MSRLLDGVVVVGAVVVVPVLLAVGVSQPRVADVQHVNPSTVVTSTAEVGVNLQPQPRAGEAQGDGTTLIKAADLLGVLRLDHLIPATNQE